MHDLGGKYCGGWNIDSTNLQQRKCGIRSCKYQIITSIITEQSAAFLLPKLSNLSILNELKSINFVSRAVLREFIRIKLLI
jgi:hypothetical protein